MRFFIFIAATKKVSHEEKWARKTYGNGGNFLAQIRLPDGTGRGPGRSSLGFQDLLALAILMEAMII